MARTLSATLLAAQKATSRIPYIRVVINSVDYSSKVLFVEHHEEPYSDYATIVLNNADRGLDSVATLTTNLLGRRFGIGYGYTTGAGNEYSESADLWVKQQKMVSMPGSLTCELYCEGQWEYLSEQRLMAGVTGGMAIGDPDEVGDDPYFISVFERTHTVYELLEMVLGAAGAFGTTPGMTLSAAPSPDDDILSEFKPYFTLDGLPYASEVLRRLIIMAKCYLRPRANLVWQVVYPQTSDAADATYYSRSTDALSNNEMVFKSYAEALNLVIPNRYVVFCNNPDDLEEWPEPVMVGDSGAYSGNYDEVLDFQVDGTIILQGDANKRAAALLTRRKAEGLAGYLIIPHDARVEMYDKVEVNDQRGH